MHGWYLYQDATGITTSVSPIYWDNSAGGIKHIENRVYLLLLLPFDLSSLAAFTVEMVEALQEWIQYIPDPTVSVMEEWARVLQADICVILDIVKQHQAAAGPAISEPAVPEPAVSKPAATARRDVQGVQEVPGTGMAWQNFR